MCVLYIHTVVYGYTHTYIYNRHRAHVYIYIYTCIQACMHNHIDNIDIHRYVDTNIAHAYMYACMHKCIYRPYDALQA